MRIYAYVTLFVALCIPYSNVLAAEVPVDLTIITLMKEGWGVKSSPLPSGGLVVTEAVWLNGVLPSFSSIQLIKQLDSVKKLTCRVSDDLMKEIATIPTIRKLELFASNRTNGNPKDRFFVDSLNILAQNPQLEEIKLSGGLVSENSFLDAKEIAKLSSLTKLSLTGLYLRTEDLEAIAALPALESLELDVDFFQAPPQYYLKNSHLKYLTLHIRGFCFTTKDMKIFVDLVNKTSLSRLNLCFFQCDNDIPLEEIIRIKPLCAIEIRCGVFPKDIIEKLSKENRPLRLSIVEAVPGQR